MKKPTHCLIWGLLFLLAASLPRTSDAGSVYGTWQGMMSQTFAESVNGVESGPNTYVFPYTLTMAWTASPDGGSVNFDVDLYQPFNQISTSTDPFGPHSASFGGGEFAGGPGGFNLDFNLAATYSYISPEGVIVGGSAAADFAFTGILNYDPNDFTYLSISASFQGNSVPEPSAIVLMGLGLLTALILFWRPGVPIRCSELSLGARSVGSLSRRPSRVRCVRPRGAAPGSRLTLVGRPAAAAVFRDP